MFLNSQSIFFFIPYFIYINNNLVINLTLLIQKESTNILLFSLTVSHDQNSNCAHV